MIQLTMRCALRWYYRRFKRFMAGARNAQRSQREALFSKIRRNKDSDFGQAHGFADIRSVNDFRRQVPIADYDYYSAYIERVKEGQTSAMFARTAKILMFAMSSGTTDKPKYIPITEDFLSEYRDGWIVWGARNFADHDDQLGKTPLQLTHDWKQFYTEGGIPCGHISGLAVEVAPRIGRHLHAIPPKVCKIHDIEARHYATLRIAMSSRRVGMVLTSNPSTLVELARRADKFSESLIRDIHDGTLSESIEVSPQVREMLRRYTNRRNPRRARELATIAERNGSLRPKDCWPRLSLLCVWMGGSATVYLPMLKDFYGATAMRDHGLSATEGRITIPIEDGSCAGLLDYRNSYYEFVPLQEFDAPNPPVLECHELEEGREYFVLLTTSSGLYRYDIHDVVRCVGYEGETPILEFLNKGAHFSSITGEKLSEHQVLSAVRKSYTDLRLPSEQFSIAPVMNAGRPGYVLLLEPCENPRDNDQLASRVDWHLKELNMEYSEKMESGRLRPLIVKVVAPGSWDALQARKTAGKQSSVYKHPCLVNDLHFVEQMSGHAVSQTQPEDVNY